MSSSSLSPPPEQKSGSRRWAAVACLVVLAGVLAVLQVGQRRPASEPLAAVLPAEVPPAEVPPAAVGGARVTPAPFRAQDFAEAPPPPPPEPEPRVASPAAPVARETPKAGPKAAKGCDVEECKGTASVEIQRALGGKAGQVRGCYDRALGHNAGLQGKVEIDVRIGPTGEVCSVGLYKDGLGDPAVTSCVLQRFRSGTFPKPAGGCVDARVPINFLPPQ